MIDYTALLKKLTPDRDGEPFTHLRTAVVDAVNSDGTVDLEMSGGIIVPDVSKLDSAHVEVNTVVQVISFRGSMLVLGPVANLSAVNSGQVIAYHSESTDSVAGGSGAEVVIMSVTASLQDERTYRVWTEFHATPSVAGVAGAVRIRQGLGLAGTELRLSYADFPNTGTAGNHFLISTAFTATSTGPQTFTATAQGTGATMRREAASSRLSEMWVTS